MYLVATAMLVFGVGLHVLFMGSNDLRHIDKKSSSSSQSNYLKVISSYLGISRSLFVLLLLTALEIWFCQTIPSQLGMNSIMQAKTKIGHAVVMILQVGVLEKFQSVPLVTGLDLACFAGAVFLSATCIFLLSKLSIINNTQHGL